MCLGKYTYFNLFINLLSLLLTCIIKTTNSCFKLRISPFVFSLLGHSCCFRPFWAFGPTAHITKWIFSPAKTDEWILFLEITHNFHRVTHYSMSFTKLLRVELALEKLIRIIYLINSNLSHRTLHAVKSMRENFVCSECSKGQLIKSQVSLSLCTLAFCFISTRWQSKRWAYELSAFLKFKFTLFCMPPF